MGNATAAPPGALDLVEAIESQPTALADDGTTLIHIIRPGLGLGRGNHFYPASMLQENAHKFTGWSVFIDHESPEAKRARGGLPRSMRDVGGLIEESWWDPNIAASDRHEAGAVVGRMRPIRELKEIVEQLPQAARFSIKAKATDVQEGRHNGQPVWMVEGISDNPPGSVDAVTQAGAGGRIAAIQESLDAERIERDELELAEAVLTAKSRKNLSDSDFAIPENREYPIHDESHARNALTRVSQFGTPEQKKRVRAAVKRRYPNIEMQEATHSPADSGEGGIVKELEEALRDPDSPVSKAVNDLVEAKATEKADEAVEERVQEAVQATEERAERELREAVEYARQEERYRTDRQRQLIELREAAHDKIADAKLPEKLAKRLEEAYEIGEDGEPSGPLDVSDRVDTEGNIVESAKDQLAKRVDGDIQEARDLLAELHPTRVEGEGAGGGAEPEGEGKVRQSRKPFWKEHLEEAHIDPDEAYALSGAGKEE